jgi:hypothetical protein
MKLFLLTQMDNNTYDTFDSILVCAENEDDAVTIDPYGDPYVEGADYFTSWAKKASSIICEEIGEANDKHARGVIIASYNAG